MKWGKMQKLVVALMILLLFLHHDFWWWDDKTLVLGFLPIGLAYHAFYSVMCAVVMWMAVRFAWPEHIEREAEEHQEEAS